MPGRGRPWKGVGQGNPDRIGTAAIADGSITEADLDSSVASKLNQGGHAIQDEGTPLTQQSNMNFVGAGVDATTGGEDTTIITIPGGGGGGIDHFAQIELLEDFFYKNPSDTWLTTVKYDTRDGNGSSVSLDVPDSPRFGGVILMRVNVTLNGQGSTFRANDVNTDGGHFLSDKNTTMRVRLALQDVTSRVDSFGLVDDPFSIFSIVTGTANCDNSVDEGFYFKKESGGNWIAVSQDSNSGTETDTGVSATTNVMQDFEIVHIPGVSDVFSIDGNVVVTHTTDIADSGVRLRLEHTISALGDGFSREIELDLWHVVQDR